jgi:hypothetical protein
MAAQTCDNKHKWCNHPGHEHCVRCDIWKGATKKG